MFFDHRRCSRSRRSGRRCGSGAGRPITTAGAARLVIRRFLDIRDQRGLPGPNNRISLGTWYAEDGRQLDVVGHFVDGGRGLMCNIGDQPFELYLHTRDPYRAGGRTLLEQHAVRRRDVARHGDRRWLRLRSQRNHRPVGHRSRRLARPAAHRRRPVVRAGGRLRWPAERGSTPGATAHRVDAHVDFGGTTATSASSCSRTRARTDCSAA